MDVSKLARMANQIGSYFAAEPERAVGLEGVASHLRRFWDPRMRRALIAWVDGGGREGLVPLVLEAIQLHRERLLEGTGTTVGPAA